MSELRYPNESREYRDARDALLKEEQELIDKVKSVAAKRRKLPLGGQLKEDYVFQWANDGKVGKSVKFSELFGDKNTLLLYSFMFGPNWDKPCPSCTSLVDGFDRTWYQVTRDAAFVAIAKAPADRINAWAKERGWSQIALVSGFESPYQADYKCQGDSDDMQLPVMHVFRKQDGKIFHFWGTETDVEPCRHGVAVLESDGLHARGPAGHCHAAAEVQVGVSGKALSEQRCSADRAPESLSVSFTIDWGTSDPLRQPFVSRCERRADVVGLEVHVQDAERILVGEGRLHATARGRPSVRTSKPQPPPSRSGRRW